MSADTTIRAKVTVNTQQLTRMSNQLKRLRSALKTTSISGFKTSRSFKKVDSSSKKSVAQLKRLNKRLQNQNEKQKQAAASLKKLTTGMNNYTKASKKLDAATGKNNQSLGFTGLAFGLVGATAGLAARQIRETFLKTIEESSTLLSEINRISLFSDVGIDRGTIALSGFENQLQRTFDFANKFGILPDEAALALKEIEKSATININSDQLANVIGQLSTLENGVDVSKLTADFTTVSASFPEQDLEEIGDFIFALSKATKLSFGPSAKNVGFIAQEAKRVNSTLEETGRVLATIIAATPGERSTAGRGASGLVSNLTDPKAIAGFRKYNLEIQDELNNYIGIEKLINKVSDRFLEYDAQSNARSNQFLNDIGLDANSKRALFAYVTAPDELKEAIQQQFAEGGGNLDIAALDQASKPEAVVNRFKIAIAQLQANFTKGVIPSLASLNEEFSKILDKSDVNNVITELGQSVGGTLLFAFKSILPVIKVFTGFLNDNRALIGPLGVGLVILTAALTAVSIAALAAGGAFASQFILEQLAKRYTIMNKLLITQTKLYGKLGRAITFALRQTTRFFTAIALSAFRGVAAVLTRLALIFIPAGGRAAIFFGTAFNIVSSAFIGAGKWVKSLFVRIGALFFGLGVASGGAFSGAFTTTSTAGTLPARSLAAVFARITGASGAGGAVSGLAFSGTFTTTASAGLLPLKTLGSYFAKLGVIFFGAGASGGGVFAAGFASTSVTGLFPRAAIASLFAKIAAASALAGSTAGIAFSSAFSAISSAFSSIKVAFFSLFTKLGLISATAGGTSGVAYRTAYNLGLAELASSKLFAAKYAKVTVISAAGGATSGVAFSAGFNKATLLAILNKSLLVKMFAPIIAISGLSGVSAGAAFGTAFAVAATAAIAAAGAVIASSLVDVSYELVGGFSPLKQIQKDLGVENPQSILDILKDVTGIDVKGDNDISEASGGFLIPGIRPREGDAKSDDPFFNVIPNPGGIFAPKDDTLKKENDLIVQQNKAIVETISLLDERNKIAVNTDKINVELEVNLGNLDIVNDEITSINENIDKANKINTDKTQSNNDYLNEFAQPNNYANPDFAKYVPKIIPPVVSTPTVNPTTETTSTSSPSVQPAIVAENNSRLLELNSTFGETDLLFQNKNVLTTLSNELLVASNDLFSRFNNVFGQTTDLFIYGNGLLIENNRLTLVGNNLAGVNNTLVNYNSDLLDILNPHIETQITEVVRNFNALSELTTIVAVVQLMFARLIGEGNRAAGKLASLRVSSSGRFSITDPGISNIDRSYISNAEENLRQTRENQVKYSLTDLNDDLSKIKESKDNEITNLQTVNIEINPIINVENASDVDVDGLVNDINDQLSSRLQKSAALVAL